MNREDVAIDVTIQDKHPEQAGGDERTAFELFVRKHCGMPAHIAVNWDAKFTNDAWEGWKARAALAQPSPAQAEQHWPKLEKPAQVGAIRFRAGLSSRLVVEAAQRLYEFESTPEKEAERIERLQAFREQCFEPLGAEFSKVLSENLVELSSDAKPEQADEKPGDSILCYGCFAKGVGPDHFDEAGKCLAAQAEAERPELWAVHAQGPDELYAAFTREDAEKHAAELNALPMPEGIAVGAVVVPSPWPAVQHWQYLAEQEQDHKNEIAGRLRQLERICEGLPQDAIDGGWTVQGIRGYAKRLEDQLKAAQARVADMKTMADNYCALLMDANAKLAEMERQEPVALANRGLHAFWVKWTEAAAGLYGPGIKLYAAPVAQAQHSVPVAREQLERLVRILDAHNYAKDAEALMALLAAAPGKEVPQAWLDVQAERRRQVEAEGWTPEHDDLYCAAELPRAAAAYILNGANDEAPAIWPFSAKWWKPRDARSNYVRAGALILAEIERLDRAAHGKEVGHE
ncbi:hypothetical protein NRT23_006040 [Pseudomonas aeruginosa]|uniref:hypothetical protein n=1 Tax=Pseudomonas aeruginosa TaxID=287 RepID=UPI000A7F698B|nr:hypothetical protein [Pseudomonas aeruginosa]